MSSWTPIKSNEGGKLQEFAIALEQAKTAMTGMDYMGDLSTARVMRQLWEKLPRYLRSKWCERANAIRVAKGRMAGFEDFVQFVTKQADLATDPVYSEELVTLESSQPTTRDHRNKESNFRTFPKEQNEQLKGIPPCVVCHKMHNLDQCFQFKKRTLSQRKDFLKIKGMCYGCYNRGHIATFCKQRKLCQIHVCKKHHPTALHDPH